MSSHRFSQVFIASILLFSSSIAFADGGGDGIGFYTAVSGRVSVIHPHQDRVIPVTLHDQVLFKDVIQTQDESRTKAFFQDDSILTVGENSRIEINEYIYKPEENVRRAVVKLMEGQVRALVSKVFKANGSRFEVHTPSAVAAARGTYFTVWVENGQSGIINIGETGRVDFTSGGTTVAVDPGYFSVARSGEAPSAPVKHHLGEHTQQAPAIRATEDEASTSTLDRNSSATLENLNLPQVEVLGLPQALAAVERTFLGDGTLTELPSQLLQAINLDTHLVTTLITMAGATTQSLSGIVSGTVQATGPINVVAQVGGDGTGQGTSLASVSAGVGSTGVTATVGPVNAGPVSVGPISAGVGSTGVTATVGPVNAGPISVGPVSVTPVSVGPISVAPISVGPVSVGPVAVAPVTVAPTVVVPTVTLPTVTVALPVPVAPITVGPVSVVPTTPVLPVTPPAVINGALNLLGH